MSIASPLLALDIDLATRPTEAWTIQDAAPGGAGEPPAGEDTQPGGGILGGMMVPMLVVFAIFYFVMIGPERKARKKREAMLAAIKKGDPVITSGGLYGTIAALSEDTVTLQIDDGVRVKFSRSAIQTVVGAGEPTKS